MFSLLSSLDISSKPFGVWATKRREQLDPGIAGLAHPQMSPSHSRFTRRGVYPPYRKQNRQRMPPQMGRLLPLTIRTNPENASQIIPAVFPTGPASPATCAMRNLSLPDRWCPVCPPAEGEETHIESITKGYYHNICNMSSISHYILCHKKCFSNFFRLMQKFGNALKIYYVVPSE